MTDITDTPEYRAGWAWAKEYGPELVELFSSADVATPEFRMRLFAEAARRWPSKPGDLTNDLRQTAFVAGAIRAAIETLPLDRAAAAAVFDAAQEMGFIWGAEQAKLKYIEDLKTRPRGWWQRRFGDATPNAVVGALSVAWRHDHPGENPRGRFHVLIDQLGSRELGILSKLDRIERRVDGEYVSYYVVGDGDTMQIIAEPVYDGRRIIHYPGEIVG